MSNDTASLLGTQILKCLQNESLNSEQLALRVHRARSTVRKYINVLHTHKLIHIGDWVPTSTNHPKLLAVYSIGAGTDKPKPVPIPAKVASMNRKRANKSGHRASGFILAAYVSVSNNESLMASAPANISDPITRAGQS